MKTEKVLEKAVKLLQQTADDKIKHDGVIRNIQKLFEAGFVVQDQKGNRKIESKTLQQAMWRLTNKMKFLDFNIHSPARPPLVEKIVTDGVYTVAEKGNLIRSLRDKNGAFFQLLLYGDAFVMLGTDEGSKHPIQFNPISLSNIYVDSYATNIRGNGIGKDVSEICIVFSLSKEEAKARYRELYPKITEASGEITRYLTLQKEQERTFNQEQETDREDVEIGFYYNIREKEFLVFAGSEKLILKRQSGDKYPFIKDGKPYIPIAQFMCMPSSEGFWNYGIGHILYELAVVTRRMLNMAVGHLDENTYPITLVNIPKGEAATFFNKLKLAHEMREKGKKGMVAIEYDVNSPGSNQVQSQSLLTQNLITEWQIVYERLDAEIRRLGINLDDIGYDPNTTATQVIAEEESANAFIKQIGEYNASESKFLIEMTMQFIKDFISKKDKTPLQLTTQIPGSDIDFKWVTMGMLKEELDEYEYFVKMNARSGSLPSNVMQIAQIQRTMAITPPGTKAFIKLQEQYARLNDQDLLAEDFVPPQSPEPSEIEAPEQAASETEKLSPEQMTKLI